MVESRRSRQLAQWTLTLAAGVTGLALGMVRIVEWVDLGRWNWASPGPRTWAAALFECIGAAGATLVLLVILTWIEHRGIRFFGARRGWRVTPAVATAVCAHASIGWLVGSLLLLLTLASEPMLRIIGGRVTIDGGRMVLGSFGAGALFAGLMWFEILVFLGARRCRFANPPGAEGKTLDRPSGAAAGLG